MSWLRSWARVAHWSSGSVPSRPCKYGLQDICKTLQHDQCMVRLTCMTKVCMFYQMQCMLCNGLSKGHKAKVRATEVKPVTNKL